MNTGTRMDKEDMVHIHSGVSVIEKVGIMLFAVTGMELKFIILSR